MVSKTTDRRIRKTKKALKEGLTELMKEKSFLDITVRELAEKVDINRGTFYLHYKDIFDMVSQIEEEIFQEFQLAISAHNPVKMNGQPLPLLIEIFEILKENAIICTALLSEHGDIIFVERLKQLIKINAFNAWRHLFSNKNADKFEYFYSYMLSGCIGLFTAWLQNGLKEKPKEMAILTQDMILLGINVLK